MGVFEALGDPARRLILELLAVRELSVSEIVEALRPAAPMSQPAVSQHLRALLDAGLVTVRAAGRQRMYALDPDGIARAQGWLARLTDPLAPFAQPLDALATEVARGRRAQRPRVGRQVGSAAADHAPTDHAPTDHAPTDHAPTDHAPTDHGHAVRESARRQA